MFCQGGRGQSSTVHVAAGLSSHLRVRRNAGCFSAPDVFTIRLAQGTLNRGQPGIVCPCCWLPKALQKLFSTEATAWTQKKLDNVELRGASGAGVCHTSDQKPEQSAGDPGCVTLREDLLVHDEPTADGEPATHAPHYSTSCEHVDVTEADRVPSNDHTLWYPDAVVVTAGMLTREGWRAARSTEHSTGSPSRIGVARGRPPSWPGATTGEHRTDRIRIAVAISACTRQWGHRASLCAQGEGKTGYGDPASCGPVSSARGELEGEVPRPSSQACRIPATVWTAQNTNRERHTHSCSRAREE
jgi:hypothetical protein